MMSGDRRLTPEDLDRIEECVRAGGGRGPAWIDTLMRLVDEVRRSWDDLRRAMAATAPTLPSSPPARVFAGWDEGKEGWRDKSVTQVLPPQVEDLPGTGWIDPEVIRWEGEGGRPVDG